MAYLKGKYLIGYVVFVSVTGAVGMVLGSSSLPPVWSCGTMEMATTSSVVLIPPGVLQGYSGPG